MKLKDDLKENWISLLIGTVFVVVIIAWILLR